MCKLVPNKPFGQILQMLSTNSTFLKTFITHFSYIEKWYTDQNSHPLKIQDRIDLTLVIKWYSYYKNGLFNWT